MKKLILKTALITLSAIVIVCIAVFGIMSFVAPATMMRLTQSIGLTAVSGDYAFQEYERSGDLSYLARAFEISAQRKDDRTADERFRILYGEEESERRAEFSAFCEAYDVPQDGIPAEGVPQNYRMYLCGQAAQVKYRLSKSESEKTDAYAFALAETDAAFSKGNPIIYLALEAVESADKEFCAYLATGLRGSDKFGEEIKNDNGDYRNIVKFLEDVK